MFVARLGRVAAVVVLGAALQSAAATDAPTLDRSPPEGMEALPVGWYAEIRLSQGRIIIQLHPEQAPQSVAHFTALAEGRLEWIDPFTGEPRSAPYYDGLEVHKVQASQRFELGDRTGTGRGAAPFYVPEEGKAPASFDQPWRVGMTRASLGRISGSQFFVTAAPQPFLRERHPCFGTVVAGRDLVRTITEVPASSAGKPLQPIVVEHVRVFLVGEVPDLPDPKSHDPKPRRLQVNPNLLEDDRGG